ncbi:MAG: bifunctional glutamate N-acetyltransferase/amino-acid acetyltransferase ArgJ [Nitrospinae bacterium]|nr:bifunctional glutamate N-acetyltransferase/amino-acid acetyltransferase ArgJ [Nitrospinota bacterium]
MKINPIKGGITAVKGITAAGISCGIKKTGKKDLALVRSNPPAVAAGVFTTNIVVASSVRVCRENLSRSEKAQAIIANSGNANACTGEQGLENTVEIIRLAAASLGVPPESVLIASTGIIGVQLPMECFRKGIPDLAGRLHEEGGSEAAQAVMTTDLVPKECAVEYEFRGKKITVGGMAKGSGMIQPDMATMLAFIASDISIEKKLLQKVLKEAVDVSFNRITVDGETSTNDMVVCLANGLAGNSEIREEGEELDAFRWALETVCLDLAKAIVRDGEGATKFIEIRVTGTGTDSEAERIARRIANSMLVKTAFFGKDPNWGRILAAAGTAGVAFDPDGSELFFEDVKIMEKGCPSADVDKASLKKIMEQKEINVLLRVGRGEGTASIFTTDLSHGYVRINAEYTT